MVITTAEEAASEDMMLTRVYPVAHLLDVKTAQTLSSAPLGGSGGSGSGSGSGYFSMSQADNSDATSAGTEAGGRRGAAEATTSREDAAPASHLIDVIHDMTSPLLLWSDTHGEGGAISMFGNNLVILQTHAGHQQIVRLLNLLTSSTEQASRGR